MKLFFQGGDASDHRKRLQAGGVKHVSLSFHQLEKRIKRTAEWKLEDHFEDDVTILVDSGAFSSSKGKEDWTDDDWRSYVDRYCAFIEANVDRADIVTEFDGLVLGREFIEDMRENYWQHLGISEKFMPVWHEEHGGLSELQRLAEEYDRVAITNTSLDARRVMANRLNGLITKYGLKLHGLAITKPDDILAVRFDSVSSTSWVSPMRYGDTIIWDGHRLRRYPMKYKEASRKRNKRLFEKAGFDPVKIQEDDPNEVVAMSIWSWLQFEEAMNRRKGLQVVDDMPDEEDEGPIASTWVEEAPEPSAETAPEEPAISPPEVRNLPALPAEELPPLPVFGFERVGLTNEQGEQAGSTTVARLQKVSIRQCDTCLVPETKILYTDMTWRPIGQAQVGDEIFGFDEHGRRKTRRSVIEAVRWDEKPTMEIVTKNGSVITTAEHRWLVESGHAKDWYRTDELRPGWSIRSLGYTDDAQPDDDYCGGYIAGMTKGDGSFSHGPQRFWQVALTDEDALIRLASCLGRFGVHAEIKAHTTNDGEVDGRPVKARKTMRRVEVRRDSPVIDQFTGEHLCEGEFTTVMSLLEVPSTPTKSYLRGYLAGFFDAEGSFDGSSVRVYQVDRTVLAQVCQYADILGFDFRIEDQDRHCGSARLYGTMADRLRFFQTVQPAILRKMRPLFDKGMRTGYDEVLEIRPAGVRQVVDIQTSTATFVAEGLATHNCYVAATCPAVEPGSACKFSIPVEIRTKEQLMASMQSVVEMQMQRVAFARYSEELEGGYIDPNLSNEIDRFFGTIAKMREINDNRDFLKIQVEGRGDAGVLSRLFGEKNVQQAGHPIDPQRAEEALADIIQDAEIIDE